VQAVNYEIQNISRNVFNTNNLKSFIIKIFNTSHGTDDRDSDTRIIIELENSKWKFGIEMNATTTQLPKYYINLTKTLVIA